MPTHQSRIFVAADTAGGAERLIRATHPGHARRFAVAVHLATHDDLERLLSKGVRVENGAPPPEEKDPTPDLPGLTD